MKDNKEKIHNEAVDTYCDLIKSTVSSRGGVYALPIDNFTTIAEFWTTYLGVTIRPDQVANMMILTKVARLKNTPAHEDTILDIGGYAATLQSVILTQLDEVLREQYRVTVNYAA